MALVVPNTADVLMLKFIVNQLKQDGSSGDPSGERLLKLFTNNIVPSKTTVLGDVTEATQSGYTATTLSGANWTVSTSTAGTNSAVYTEKVFTFTTAATVYGYYVTNLGGGELLWVERFSTAPFSLPSGGGEIGVTARLTLD